MGKTYYQIIAFYDGNKTAKDYDGCHSEKS